jgi:hypothetical protein
MFAIGETNKDLGWVKVFRKLMSGQHAEVPLAICIEEGGPPVPDGPRIEAGTHVQRHARTAGLLNCKICRQVQVVKRDVS